MTNKGMSGHHRAYEGETNVWLTPPDLLAKLGTFDLDPCAATSRPWDTAKKHFTIEDDGLAQDWTPYNRIWLNPPYGPHTGIWLKRLAEHGNGIALIFARTETRPWFNYVWGKADAILFLAKRLWFYTEKGEIGKTGSGAPSALIAYGKTNIQSLRESGLSGAMVYGCDIIK